MQQNDNNNDDERQEDNGDNPQSDGGPRQFDVDSGGQSLPKSGGSYRVDREDLAYDYYVILSELLNKSSPKDFNRKQ